jgi:hypothetical protein
MKKAIVLLLTLMVLIASFVVVGGVSADENAEHICALTGLGLLPGDSFTSRVYDVNGNIVSEYTVTNNTSDFMDGSRYLYIPAVSGVEVITVHNSYFGDIEITFNINEWYSGICFDDGRLNSRPDRDLAAPVAIYIRFAENGDGYDGFEVYDINQVAGTGLPAFHVTSDEISAAYDEALATGANVTVAQQDDILFTMLAPTGDEGVCQVNALDQEGKIYEFSWVCWS